MRGVDTPCASCSQHAVVPEMLHGVAGCRLVEGDEPAAFAAAVRAVLEAGEHPPLPERYNIRRCAALYRELYEGNE